MAIVILYVLVILVGLFAWGVWIKLQEFAKANDKWLVTLRDNVVELEKRVDALEARKAKK